VLDQILDNKNIDTKNVQYDFDFTKEFTWDFRDLVEIKKRKRFVLRTYKPTFKVLSQLKSAMSFKKAKAKGKLISSRKYFQGYELYEYFPNTFFEEKESAAKATAQHQLNVQNAGKPLVKASANESQGRRIKLRPTFKMVWLFNQL